MIREPIAVNPPMHMPPSVYEKRHSISLLGGGVLILPTYTMSIGSDLPLTIDHPGEFSAIPTDHFKPPLPFGHQPKTAEKDYTATQSGIVIFSYFDDEKKVLYVQPIDINRLDNHPQ